MSEQPIGKIVFLAHLDHFQIHLQKFWIGICERSPQEVWVSAREGQAQ